MTELHQLYRQIAELEDGDEKQTSRSDSFSFIVRVWKDTSADQDNPAGWRGSVEQVGQNRRIYVHQLDSILTFIEEQTGMRVKHSLSLKALWRGLQRWWNR